MFVYRVYENVTVIYCYKVLKMSSKLQNSYHKSIAIYKRSKLVVNIKVITGHSQRLKQVRVFEITIFENGKQTKHIYIFSLKHSSQLLCFLTVSFGTNYNINKLCISNTFKCTYGGIV
jgi:hypothetical protein